MDEQALRRMFREEVDASVGALEKRLREELAASEKRLREELAASEKRLRQELAASEKRLADNGRMMFGQLTDIYRSTLEKIEHSEKHLAGQIAQARGAIEALTASLERQDFRADDLGRRITALETRHEQPHEDI